MIKILHILLVTKGICYTCKDVFTSTQMGRHLLKCTKISTVSKEPSFVLKITGHESWYWMFVKIDGDCTLDDLDSFLRDIWLECCGHLSNFIIDGIYYEKVKDDMFVEYDSKTMKGKVKNILYPGIKFSHEYDYGSTTTLQLKVHSIQNDIPHETGTIALLARNGPFRYNCESCGERATSLCDMCGDHDNGLYCESCLDKHVCEESGGDEPSFLSIVNSPRMGVCAYGE